MVEIVISVAAKIVEYLVAPVGRPFRYLWNYKTNLENLKNEVEKLEAQRDTVQLSIKPGEDPLPDVKLWQERVNRIIVEVSEVGGDNPEQANTQCCKGISFPNLMNRYQLSKKAGGKLKSDVVDLEQEAAKFKKVSYPTIPEEPWLWSSKGYDDFESRTSILKNIIDALRNPGVNVVGIYGMGGIGKTTLAKKVARHTKQDNLFHVIVFVEVSKTTDIKKIQQDIGEKLGLSFDDKSEGERARALYDKLKKEVTNSGEEKKEKKFLLILDNIWGKIDLERIGIPLGGDCKGLKLLLTTRNFHVLTHQMDSQYNFLVNTLEEAEAWSLFKSTAGTCVDHPDLKSIASKVAKECGNMPLVIVIVANALKNKGESTWRYALDELKNPSSESFEGITKEVYTSIKFSYDYLDSEELKKIFLLCSRMGHHYDASIRDLFRYGLGLGFFKRSNTLEGAQCRVEDLVKKLKDNSLLLDAPNESSESHSYSISDNERFAMHNVICNIARSIACEKGNVCIVIDDVISCSWAKRNILKNCNSITLHNIGELPRDLKLVLPQLKFFYMKPKNTFSRISDDFFTDISSLLVLHLIEMNLSPLPTSLSHLVNLQTLCLDACKLGDIADIGKLEKLEFLSFCGSEIRELPEEMCQLTSIRLLDLTNCSKLEIIPPTLLSRFTQLEALYMYNTLIMWEVRGLNIGRILEELKHLHDRLTTLEISIPNVKMSEGLLSPHLKRYKISIDRDRISPPKNSRTLRVKLNTNDNVDEVISQLKGIKQLELGCADRRYGFTADSKQSVSLDALFSLESLSLDDLNFEKICNVPLAEESFCQLRTITVLRCDKLTNIFSFSIDRVLPKLQEIEVSSCKNMEEIFAIEREDDVNNTELIHEIQFSQLCSVTLSSLPQLKSFCHTVKATSQLQLTSSTNDGEIISEDMIDIPKSLFNDKIGFPSLKAMEIMRCPKFKEFIFDDKVAIPNLEKLKISCMDNLEKIWHNQLVNDSFYKLKSLEVEGCMKLLNVFPSNIHGRLLSLESLVVTACGSLEEIFDLRELSIYDSQIMLSFANLQKLRVEECGSLKNLFSASILAKEGVVMEEAPARFFFPRLTSLELKYLPQLRSFYPGRHKVEGLVLKTLVLSLCGIHDTDEDGQMQQPFLLSLVEEAFHCLEVLELTGKNVTMLWYDESTVLPFGIIQRCQNLEKFLLHGISYKKIFQHGEDQTRTKIKTLHLYYLKNLKYIWKQNSKLDLIIQNLEVLKVGWCHSLINLMPPSTSFQNLTSLEVKHCNSLINIGTSTVAKSLVQLTEMSISSCEKITEVIGNHGDVIDDKIIFRKLKSLKLQYLPSLTSFCSWNFKSNFTLKFPSLETLTVQGCSNLKIFSQGDLTTEKLQEVKIDRVSVELHPDFNLNTAIQQSHKKAVGFRGIENLTLSKFPHLKEVWHNQFPVSIFGNLKSLVVDNDRSSLRYIPSAALDLVQLQELKITNCGILETIIEEESTDNTFFPNLNRLELKDLPKLSRFRKFAGNSIKLPSLTQLWIDNCPNMETFIFDSIYADMPASKENFHRDIQPFFDEKVGFPSLENMVISGMDNLKSIWHNQFLGNSFSFPKLKSLEVNDCQELKTIFPTRVCGSFLSLESLTIKSCGLVEEIFNLKEKHSIEATTQLKELYVDHMSNLKRIWNKDPKGMLSYGKLQKVTVFLCPNLENLFPSSVAKSLLNLVSLDVSDCELLEEIIAKEAADKLLFPKLSSLQLHNLPQLRTCVDVSCLKRLGLHHCDKVKLSISEFLGFYKTIELEGTNQCLPNLEELQLSGKPITMEWPDQVPEHIFCSLKSLELNDLESTVSPLHFIQRFGSLGKLSLNSSSYEEILLFGEVKEHPQIKHLVLSGLSDLKQIWKQGLKIDPKFQNLEILEVRSCFNLINLMSSSASFQNLRILQVWGCDGLKNLLTSSTAKSLVLLEELEVFDCKLLIEVVANEGAETEEINFRKLKSISLMYLQSLARFCSTKHTLNFPILESLVVNECPKMKIFSEGVTSTPILQKLELNWEAFE